MKTIAIRLPDVDAAMLVEVQKNAAFKNIQDLLGIQIRQEYRKLYPGQEFFKLAGLFLTPLPSFG